MDGKIRVLFHNLDGAGVNYFRTLTPAMELERNHSDEFYVEINSQIDFNDPSTIDYLKSFHIIHYHRQFLNDTKEMLNLANELRKSGTILIVDIDDYWHLPKSHPFHYMSVENKLYIPIIENLKIADYITTTTDLFASEIKKMTNKDNIGVFYNSIDPIWMKQFQNNWKPDPDGRVRITYMAGSCYDDKTEIFTENGWKLFKDLSNDEKVATLNANTNELEFQNPRDYTVQTYSGEMYYGKNSLIDFAVTPNHNMFISKSKRSNNANSNYELIKMENLEKQNLTFMKNCKWNGSNDEYNIIPEYVSSNGTIYSELKIKMNDWIKFFGYWMGNGWISDGDSKEVGICTFKKSSAGVVDEIRKIFDEYGICSAYNKNKSVLKIFNIQLFEYLRGLENKFTVIGKHIPKAILNLNSEYLKTFLDYYVEANGCVRNNGKLTAYGMSLELANDLSEIALKIESAAIITNKSVCKFKFFSETEKIAKVHDNLFVVDIYPKNDKNKLLPVLSYKDIVKENYNGYIYCVTVPNHIIYVRRNGKSYWCGNSHMGDVEQLNGVMNAISNDFELKDKFKVIIAGWDTEGSTTDITFNNELGIELQKRGLWTDKMVKAIDKSKGNIDLISDMPQDLKNKYRNNLFDMNQRDIKSQESVYFHYEKILTNNHKMIENSDYLQWLMNFERNVAYENEGNFARRWTQKANTYASVLDETDILIAPLEDNMFNKMKSNLKQVECWSRKLPIICSNIPPYNVHGRHMENCILVKSDKQHAYKEWRKYLKKLILDADLRKMLGEQLYEDFKEEYNLANVTKNRAEFYKKIIAKTLKLL